MTTMKARELACICSITTSLFFWCRMEVKNEPDKGREVLFFSKTFELFNLGKEEELFGRFFYHLRVQSALFFLINRLAFIH